MTLPPLCSAALILFALAGAIVGWAYRHAPVIHDRLSVEPVVEDGMEYDNE